VAYKFHESKKKMKAEKIRKENMGGGEGDRASDAAGG
jgi:hypothetical protein